MCNCATTRRRYEHCENCDTRLPDSYPSWCTCPVYNLDQDTLCGNAEPKPKIRTVYTWASKYPK